MQKTRVQKSHATVPLRKFYMKLCQIRHGIANDECYVRVMSFSTVVKAILIGNSPVSLGTDRFIYIQSGGFFRSSPGGHNGTIWSCESDPC